MKKIVTCALAFVLTALIVSGCVVNATNEERSQRFEMVSSEVVSAGGFAAAIKDTQTGVCYLFYKSGYGAGMTVLVNEGGTPLVEEEAGNLDPR